MAKKIKGGFCDHKNKKIYHILSIIKCSRIWDPVEYKTHQNTLFKAEKLKKPQNLEWRCTKKSLRIYIRPSYKRENTVFDTQKKVSTIENLGKTWKSAITREFIKVKNWSSKFCPLLQEIPLLWDTLLPEATVFLILSQKHCI